MLIKYHYMVIVQCFWFIASRVCTLYWLQYLPSCLQLFIQ